MSYRLQSVQMGCERTRMQVPIPIFASVHGHAQAVVVIVDKVPLRVMGDDHRSLSEQQDQEMDHCALAWKRAA